MVILQYLFLVVMIVVFALGILSMIAMGILCYRANQGKSNQCEDE